jgi:hypothetical protein
MQKADSSLCSEQKQAVFGAHGNFNNPPAMIRRADRKAKRQQR